MLLPLHSSLLLFYFVVVLDRSTKKKPRTQLCNRLEKHHGQKNAYTRNSGELVRFHALRNHRHGPQCAESADEVHCGFFPITYVLHTTGCKHDQRPAEGIKLEQTPNKPFVSLRNVYIRDFAGRLTQIVRCCEHAFNAGPPAPAQRSTDATHCIHRCKNNAS
jgi:hypothetical protein